MKRIHKPKETPIAIQLMILPEGTYTYSRMCSGVEGCQISIFIALLGYRHYCHHWRQTRHYTILTYALNTVLGTAAPLGTAHQTRFLRGVSRVA